MMLEIYRAKPNPLGKDRNRYNIPNQLNGEWVDIRNITVQNIDLRFVSIANMTFGQHCDPHRPTLYWLGNQTLLGPQQVARLHTGLSLYSGNVQGLDAGGVNMHLFAERQNYVLNNKCGDSIFVYHLTKQNTWTLLDQASYDPNPGEGRILSRIGIKLK
jgi:hypothetical protein